MKTAVSVLQELAVKLGKVPEYECVGQTGPPHLAVFQYRCTAMGATVIASARSKKEAKQEAARLCLAELAARGMPVNQSLPSSVLSSGSVEEDEAVLPSYSYVALLKELCEQYRLPASTYQLVGDAGPAHLRHFTVRVSVGGHAREATATTKKAARQLAASYLYKYLRENLAKATRDFAEEEALVRAHEKAMDRYRELNDEQPWRPDLGQRIADYPDGLIHHTEKQARERALSILNELNPEDAVGAETKLEEMLEALGLAAEWTELDTSTGPMPVLQVPRASPALAFCGLPGPKTRAAAAAAAIDYLRLALNNDTSDAQS
ncbi:Interferon-inducible double-stranded RNA-dependent protein kinase activator A homolog A [Eumeta japonica]|uniref:Interferon-inducible double-stranded RNA-dependent protein kinase activator A homolog A n=1 Tax=Eumeta variegata TaxID=151549 RepID=A0A4C1T211_EUMVA|nr:Interferon-inducible double-stranded RNA-dependent protein kinase activator A homolog A [Eumeta japonica]